MNTTQAAPVRRNLSVVVFRTGGYANFKWQRALPVETRDEALTQLAETQRMGFKAFIADYDKSMSIGLPETHCTDKACPCVKVGAA